MYIPFNIFHGGHIINLDYTILLKKEVEKIKKERKNAETPGKLVV